MCSEGQPRAGKLSILIADDERILAEVLRRSLEPKYHVIDIVGDGAAAIAACDEHRPDILLLDISMPVMNGLQAAKHIAEQCPSVRIIFVTSHTDRAYVEEAFHRGAFAYVRKGSLTELEDAIQTVLQGQHYRPPLLRTKTSSL